MREVLEGSLAVARTVARCRPGVVCAYPISPQTHIVEALARYTRTGELVDCEYINVESEFAAMSVAIGASAAGARVYTATASQGLLYMAEAVYNASGMGLPIVMTIANRAIGAPINIWNDHSDSLSQRDSGWLQLFAADPQDAVDLHVQAFAVAEELSVPVMVCMDGFVLTHASDVVEVPTQEQVDSFLPPFAPRQVLSPEQPTTIGTMAGPDTFTETRYLQHQRMLDAEGVVADVAARFARAFGRASGGLLRLAEDDSPPPGPQDVVVVAMGSVLGTLQEVRDDLVADGLPVRLVGIGAYRPFPEWSLREALGVARRVVVVDRALQLGIGGVLTADVRRALRGMNVQLRTVVAGLGGREIPETSLRRAIRAAAAGELEELHFLDLDPQVLAAVSLP